MSDLNQVALFGHITKNAEKVDVKGRALVSFSIANNYVLKGEDGNFVERTDFFYIKLWGNVAEKLLPHLVKGQGITVEARLRQRRWIDKLTQKVRSRLELVPVRISFVGGKPKSKDGEAAPAAPAAAPVDAASLAGDALGDDIDDGQVVDENGIPVSIGTLSDVSTEDEDLRD